MDRKLCDTVKRKIHPIVMKTYTILGYIYLYLFPDVAGLLLKVSSILEFWQYNVCFGNNHNMPEQLLFSFPSQIACTWSKEN